MANKNTKQTSQPSPSDLDFILKEFSKMMGGDNKSQNYNNEDDRFWKCEVDKSGNGYAIIRFLDQPEGEDLPMVRIFNHGFKGPTGSWYIENSLTTLNRPDPVSEYNTKLWNSGVESDKEIARAQKRRLTLISNILVVKDPANPANEGKVFLFRYGKKIFDKLKTVMNPEYVDETPMNPFDPREGANFKLKIRNVEGYRNYDNSQFEEPSSIGNDDAIKKIHKQKHSLAEFVDPKNFKSYEELQEKLNRVLGLDNSQKSGKSNVVSMPKASTKNRTDDDEITSGELDDSVLESLLND